MQKSIGFVLIVIGILTIFYTGFSYATTKKVVDLGSIQIDKKENHPVEWSPFFGVTLLFAGIVVFARSKKTGV
jgi:uncharacterized membrane protein YidH (DUF202 family)